MTLHDPMRFETPSVDPLDEERRGNDDAKRDEDPSRRLNHHGGEEGEQPQEPGGPQPDT